MFFGSKVIVTLIEFHEVTQKRILTQNIKNLFHVYMFSCVYIKPK